MFSITLVEKLATALDKATDTKDWQQVQQVNQQIAQLLTSWAGISLSPEQHQALGQLKVVFQHAYRCCGLQKQQLKAEVDKMRHKQEGITTYAAMAITAYQNMAKEEERR